MKTTTEAHSPTLDFSKSYSKVVNDHLSISLTYLPSGTTTEYECLLTFHNTNDQSIVINPQEKQSEPAANPGWLGSIFGRGQKETPEATADPQPDPHLKLFLGHVQLFGYVVLNYNFNIDTSALEMTKSSQWWNNAEYLDQYFNNQDWKDEDLQIKALNQVPLIAKKSKLTIEGKLGGVNDLFVDHNTDLVIDSTQAYFLHDLITPFNSQQIPTSSVAAGASTISLNELTDSIVPIYSTRQSLLFTDLAIEPNSSKTFHFRFPVKDTLPPTYNARSTGLACDQGWSSIRYSLIVSVSEPNKPGEKLKPRSIYFPVNVEAQRVGISFRHLQHDYLSDETAFTLDPNWQIELVSQETKSDIHSVTESGDAREVFLQDLSKLIESDLYNMPKVSTIERRKSIPFDKLDEFKQLEIVENNKAIPQLPEHLKTQYQLRVNNQELCLISLSRPYFHIGDDINYIIDINRGKQSLPKVIGIVAYLEAHENYHIGDSNRVFTNMYKVSGNVKLNTFASAMIDASIENHTPSLINGHIHIARSLTGQFQSSSFMDLKYYLVFHFNLATMTEETEQGNSEEQHTNGSQPPDDGAGERLINGNSNVKPILSEELFAINRQYKFDGVGSGHKFKVPIYLLP
ncbi:uncharacterized protein SPAPADRAFT_137294 [Spathaspora passalidarum NRRL Y-27907]|uniref:Rgp1-domain-containing protein n=1 Tax=Spathaspora passalidarum (strain NRRL Y-27907 / 11-Y1) TaxID=619300 RepID=G3AMN3_SPAPN|nr:uncharacterized protein SPAPADRAFT_137294 [Spathaspora passalidarum NRRL Y-27907]EGW33477.1 hypothetical protein SPAPADRAFT_137294 [Spathaspora passalidarum NRRL Y-27907]